MRLAAAAVEDCNPTTFYLYDRLSKIRIYTICIVLIPLYGQRLCRIQNGRICKLSIMRNNHRRSQRVQGVRCTPQGDIKKIINFWEGLNMRQFVRTINVTHAHVRGDD